jgi:hypothetical protein
MNREKRRRKKKKTLRFDILDFVGMTSIVRTWIHAKVYKYTVNVPAAARNAVMGLETIKARKIFLITNDIHLLPSNLLKPHPTLTYTYSIVSNTSYRSLRL